MGYAAELIFKQRVLVCILNPIQVLTRSPIDYLREHLSFETNKNCIILIAYGFQKTKFILILAVEINENNF